MVYKSKPVDVLLEFEHRKYRLGDTIEVTVTLVPNTGIDIREASLNLVMEERFTEAKVTQSGGMIGGAIGGGGGFHSTDYIPMQQSISNKSNTLVHSSTQFLASTTLEAGQRAHKVALRINSDPPKRLAESQERVKDSNSSITFHWRLEAKVDVVRGRNPKVQRKVNIDLT
jgi:hypothetical protein